VWIAGVLALVAISAGAGYYLVLRLAPAATTPTSTLSPEAAAALARVKELEERLATLEREKAEAETRAAEEARKKIESQAAARGQAADPEAVQRAQEEARLRAREEQDRRQREETARLAELKRAEEQRLAEERRRAEEAAAAATAPPTAAPVATPTPEPVTTTTTTTTLPVQPGALVELTDPGVVAPVLERKPPLAYPPLAQLQKVEGTVLLSALVDEKGQVVDVRMVRPSGKPQGLDQAATLHVRQRRYHPATKDGVPVKVWVNVEVHFRLPR
jgi:TonB family protein